MNDRGNQRKSVVRKVRADNWWFYLLMILAVVMLGWQINKFWLMYKNKSCLASVYTDKVRYTLRLSALRSGSDASYKGISVLSKQKIDDDKNICEVTLYWDKKHINVRYQPHNSTRTLNAGRISDTTVYYGVDILNIKVNETLPSNS